MRVAGWGGGEIRRNVRLEWYLRDEVISCSHVKKKEMYTIGNRELMKAF